MEGKEKDHKNRHRLKGLFSKEKKPTPEGDVDEFLHGPSDKLLFQAPTPASTSRDADELLHGPSDKLNFPAPSPPPPSNPPPLTRLDTTAAPRWPTAAEVQSSRRTRRRSASPKRSRKGLAVRFTDEKPEIIGEGGDEAELPTITLRQRAHSHPPGRPRNKEPPPRDNRDVRTTTYAETNAAGPEDTEGFRPGPLRRAATGFDSQAVPAQGSVPSLPQDPSMDVQHDGYERTESHDPKSFAARVQAEMRAAEGNALLQATSNSSQTIAESLLSIDSSQELSAFDFNLQPEPPRQIGIGEGDASKAPSNASRTMEDELLKLDLPDYSPINIISKLDELVLNPSTTTYIPPAPSKPLLSSPAASIPPQLTPGKPTTTQGAQEINSSSTNNIPVPVSRSSTFNLYGAAVAIGDEALQDFSVRVSHLFNIFLLSAESLRPISKCSLEDFVRAALWWFLKGRLHLEGTIRDRPASPEAQQTSFLVRQQAYTDLAKSLWILERITPQFPELSYPQKDPRIVDLLELRESIMSNLRKLTMSMKRNNFLPPEEATLPQGLDTAIWAYEDGDPSLLASQKQAVLNLTDSFPLGDSSRSFHYGRAFTDALLREAAESSSKPYATRVLVSLIRPQKETALMAVIASQNGTLTLCVQDDKSVGPTWDDVSWDSRHNLIDIRLPRGFFLRLYCSHQDFRTLQGIHDYQKKTHRSLVPRQDEKVVFETILKTFQYFDHEPSSTFPKEPLSSCRLRLFEGTLIEKAASGPRSMHRGFRIGLVTSPTTKSLRGINQDLPPNFPIQFNFLRGEDGLPALLLRINHDKSKYKMVLTFNDVNERTKLHERLSGIALRDTEEVVVETELKGFAIASQNHPTEERDLNCLKDLEWQTIRVINEEQDDIQNPKTVLSTNLRVITDFTAGSITDRVNIGPGELKIRLDVNSFNELKILRQPQQDMTISIVESQIPRELLLQLEELLAITSTSDTTRTYTFPGLQELHLFQCALTGFSVLFDGMAVSFNISRRRMVVPIYKKWDASKTRLQLVQREKIVQLVAFFENFSHGDCMNFALKSTDVFEGSSRNNKFSLRIVDAKFAMPKGNKEGEAGSDSEFVCLDIPDYPGEHDDITIVFGDEFAYQKFTKALPAPVKAASRMASVRR